MHEGTKGDSHEETGDAKGLKREQRGQWEGEEQWGLISVSPPWAMRPTLLSL